MRHVGNKVNYLVQNVILLTLERAQATTEFVIPECKLVLWGRLRVIKDIVIVVEGLSGDLGDNLVEEIH